MSFIQATSPILPPSTLVGPSDILRRVRANLIEGSIQFYEPIMDKMINLINDYIGVDEAQEKSISLDKTSFSPATLFLSEMQKYKKKRTMTVEDRQYATDWVRTIVASQKKHARLIPPITLVRGDSEGITFVITKAQKIYGFLYGTMHNFSRGFPEGEILTHLSLDTQIRLLNCSIIGTEITVKNEPSFHSVEGPLISIADKCGIANIGIDDATCDREMVGVKITCQIPTSNNERPIFQVEEPKSKKLPQVKKPKSKEIDHVEELIKYLNGNKSTRTLNRIGMIALYSGMIELAWSAGLSRSKVEDVYQNTLAKKRNQSMADNIDTLLSSCAIVGEETREEMPPRCFFAIGIAHLIPTPAIPESVVELVAKKGWKVERFIPKEAQLTSSREMTQKEAQTIGEFLIDMNRHPLYASQRPHLCES